MFFAFAHTILTSEIITAPKRIEMQLAAGVIHQVDVVFQSGCSFALGVQIRQGDHQLWPSNREAAIYGDASVVSFREFFELRPGGNDLYAIVWGDGVIDAVQVIIQVGVLPKAILQPMSFDELLRVAQG
jgi:hypothetical protein